MPTASEAGPCCQQLLWLPAALRDELSSQHTPVSPACQHPAARCKLRVQSRPSQANPCVHSNPSLRKGRALTLAFSLSPCPAHLPLVDGQRPGHLDLLLSDASMSSALKLRAASSLPQDTPTPSLGPCLSTVW